MSEREKTATGEGMKSRDIVLFLTSLGQGRPEFGRTSLQKAAYFSSLVLGRDLGHRAHYYGPFSSTVEREMEALVLSSLVEEKVQLLGFANQIGFAAKQYEYKLTPSGEERVRELTGLYPKDADLLSGLVQSLVEHAGKLDQRVLSAAAKVHYIARQEGRPVSVPDVPVSARQLGWDLTDEQVEQVVHLLDKLSFIKVVK